MFKIFKSVKKSSFVRGAITLSFGTIIAQAISTISSPLLTRLYNPNDLGLASLYTSVVAILALISTGRYEFAIMLPKKDREASDIVNLSLKISIVFCFFIFFIFLLLKFFFNSNKIWGGLLEFIGLIPISTFFFSFFNISYCWFQRKSNYKQISLNRIKLNLFMSGLTIFFGLIRVKNGIILGTTISYFLFFLCVCKKRFFQKKYLLKFNKRLQEEKKIAIIYRGYPLHIMPSQLIGEVSQHIPLFILSTLYSLENSGYFALALKIVCLPCSLISGAIGDVYRQKISIAYKKRGEFRKEFLTTFFVLFLLSSIPFTMIFLFSEDIFCFVFGDKWLTAGTYAKILVIASFVQFVLTPLDRGALIVGATHYIFFWHLLRFLGFSFLYYLCATTKMQINNFIWVFVFLNVSLYIIDGIVGYFLSKNIKANVFN